MIGIKLTFVASLIGFSSIVASAQIASESELAAITARGRMLYEYDQAAWHASDAVMATNPPKDQLGRYIARKTDLGWEVAFGRLNVTNDAFLIAAVATQGASLQHFTVKRFDPAQSDTGFFLSAVHAIDTALLSFRGAAAGRTYNASVLPAPDGRLYVYLEPGQTSSDGDYFPLGADVRFVVSTDGKSVVETRQMHKGLIPKGEIPPGATMTAGVHSHVFSEVPEDSDVFVVLSRKPSIPEYVVTGSATYAVNTDGSIVVPKGLKKQR